MRRGFIILVVAAACVAASWTAGLSGQTALGRPVAPLALAVGDSVNLAFTLPAEPRPHRVEVWRAEKDGAAFKVVAQLDASTLAWTDSDVGQGRTYLYAIRTSRGASQSDISPPVEVTVGGSARITLVGGSTERALFEVVVFRGGRRLIAQFVHVPGETIGDLAWVGEIDGVADFRLGPKLTSLSLAEGEAVETRRETPALPDGKPMTDLAGRPIELEFKLSAGKQEVLIAAMVDKQGAIVTLREGESLDVR
jgi:hypothetical protein